MNRHMGDECVCVAICVAVNDLCLIPEQCEATKGKAVDIYANMSMCNETGEKADKQFSF